MASAPNRRRPPSNPVPITPSHPSELLQLLESKAWPAFIERVTTHPHEVGSSPCFRNERGYTVLHCLVAYNRGMAGEELAYVVEVVLRAAEDIDWGSEYLFTDANVDTNSHGVSDVNTNEVNDANDEPERPRRTGGAWRLLMDTKNQAQWSPLHLVFVQGGCTVGKVPLARALLQMNDTEHDPEEDKLSRQRVLELTDRQNRTMLHHNSETRGPREDNFEAAHFLISQCPSMLFVRDTRGNTPLEYVLNKLKDPVSTTSGLSFRRDDNEDTRRCYRMLKLLVSGMEREETRTRGAGRDGAATNISGVDIDYQHSDTGTGEVSEAQAEDGTVNVTMIEESTTSESALTTAMRATPNNPIINNDGIAPRNVLNAACRLSKSICPPDGSLITFLASTTASKLEYGNKSSKKLAEEPDEAGNYALHTFLSNESYRAKSFTSNETDAVRTNPSCSSIEYQIVTELIASHPHATSIANNDGLLPLRLAMENGLRNVVSLLVEKYPEAVQVDELVSIQVFTEVLICLSLSLIERSANRESEDTTPDTEHHDTVRKETNLFSTMYFLVRSRPDVVAFDWYNEQPTVQRIDKPPSIFKRIVKLWKR